MKSTTEPSAVPAPGSVAPVTSPPVVALLAKLWDSVPLPALLDAADADLIETPLNEDWYGGHAIWPKGGRIALVMPKGQPVGMREFYARDLLARLLDVALPGQVPLKRIAWN